ncbi:MAG: RluA family pseudouridine synthase, partial [Nitrospinota bacterium]
FLTEHPDTPGWSRARVQRLIREGHVRVEVSAEADGRSSRSVKPGMPLHRGDRVLVFVPPPEPAEAVPEDIALEVPYEDAHLLVVDKPPGMVVHPSTGHARGTLVNALLSRCPSLAGIGGRIRPGIVHRLDKDTSGLMVVAKTDLALARLQAAMKARRIERVYLALAWGSFPDQGRIQGAIGRHPLHRKKMAVVQGGRPAVTHFRVLQRFQSSALLEVRLETGRTHQIRVHLAHRGTPVLGDSVYGARHKREEPIGRQALHAHGLSFAHPESGEPLRFEAPLPEDMRAALADLRKASA